MPRLNVEIDEETLEGLLWASAYWQLPFDKTVNLILLSSICTRFTKLLIAQMEETVLSLLKTAYAYLASGRSIVPIAPGCKRPSLLIRRLGGD